jgi:hypothetical protein
MVNRDDTWVQYLPVHARSEDALAFVAPPPKLRARVKLNHDFLVRHYQGRRVQNIMGLPSTDHQGKSRWLAIVISNRETNSPSEPAWRAAAAWHGALIHMGLVPLLLDSGGQEEYQLLLLLDHEIDSSIAGAFGRWCVRGYEECGLSTAPIVLPSGRPLAVADAATWLRLPGRHHTSRHWTRVWQDGMWLEGEAAVGAIVAAPLNSGDEVKRLAQEVSPLPVALFTDLVDLLKHDKGPSTEALAERVLRLIDQHKA